MAVSAAKRGVFSWRLAAALSLGLGLGFSAPALARQAGAPPQQQKAGQEVKPAGKADAAALLRPSALPDMGEGEKNAPITLIEYASLSCSHCADFYVNTMPQLREKYVKTGKMRYILRELAMDPRSLAGSMLTRCVGQDKFFPFIQLLFEKQDDWAFVPDAKTPLMRYAKMAGLNDAEFNACLSEKNKAVFDALSKAGDAKDPHSDINEFNIRVTPTLFINGEKYEGALTMEQLSPILDKILAEKK